MQASVNAAAPSTAFAYDQKISGSNHIVFAGQITPDEESPAGGIATVWMPTGSAETGPSSTMVLREAKLGTNGLTFRGVRLDQSETLALGDRFLIRAGGEYVLVGLGAPASDLRARVKLETRVMRSIARRHSVVILRSELARLGRAAC